MGLGQSLETGLSDKQKTWYRDVRLLDVPPVVESRDVVSSVAAARGSDVHSVFTLLMGPTPHPWLRPSLSCSLWGQGENPGVSPALPFVAQRAT